MNVIRRGTLAKFFAVIWNNVKKVAMIRIIVITGIVKRFAWFNIIFLWNLFSAKEAIPSSNLPLKKEVSIIGIKKPHPINVNILLPAKIGVDVASKERIDWNPAGISTAANVTARELIMKKTAVAIPTSIREENLFAVVFSSGKEILGSNLNHIKSPTIIRI